MIILVLIVLIDHFNKYNFKTKKYADFLLLKKKLLN